jgi:hypothetical protein
MAGAQRWRRVDLGAELAHRCLPLGQVVFEVGHAGASAAAKLSADIGGLQVEEIAC